MYSTGKPTQGTTHISGVFPQLGVKATHRPARSETGIGALMPWADRLWFITYVAHKKGTGGGTGLFTLDDDMRLERHPASVVGTYANRMVHHETSQIVIGPHLIDDSGNVRTVQELVDIRVTATARHLTAPERKVYCLGMEGELFEVDMHDATGVRIADLTRELAMVQQGSEHWEQPHFKAMYSAHGRLVVANNTYAEEDHLGEFHHGRLAEWTGEGPWRIIDQGQYNEVMGRTSIGDAIFATGVDRASAILRVFTQGTWRTYRLPRATHTQDHTVTTEWPRIREVESERWMMNIAGMFYELPAMQYGGDVWGVRPVCSHLRIIGDYCSWNGLLVMAGDQTTPIGDSNAYVGQPQSGLWFGKTDDLWQWGKPTGWGGPWMRTPVKGGQRSDPFLMTGFEHKCLHVTHDGGQGVRVRVEVDITGNGDYCSVTSLEMDRSGYACHVFPTGLSGHWARLTADRPGTATAQFFYT